MLNRMIKADIVREMFHFIDITGDFVINIADKVLPAMFSIQAAFFRMAYASFSQVEHTVENYLRSVIVCGVVKTQ